MSKNLTDLEQRMIALLKSNSRRTVLDLSRELEISRITAKKILSSLSEQGVIKKFTIMLAEDERDLVLVHLKEVEGLPKDLILEYFSLIDGTYLAVMYYENLIKVQNMQVLDVKIAVRRNINEDCMRMEHMKCDYCGKDIVEKPIKLQMHRKVFYVCCSNCERDLRKRREIMEGHGEHA